MKNIKLLIVILIVAFSAFNISMSITENSENNITLNSINEHAFENECSNAISMTFGCTRCSNMNVPGCKHIPEETTSTCTIGKCSQCGAPGSYLN